MRFILGLALIAGLLSGIKLSAQNQTKPPEKQTAQKPDTPDKQEKFVVPSGTRIPLVLINSISTKNSKEGDRVYLQTSFPIAENGRIVIPQGSYVTGTVTEVKRPGRVKGKGEIYVRFDTLMLPNGVQRDFRGTISGVDADRDASLKDKEGKIEGDPTKGRDVGTIADTGATGATIGGITGGGKGAGIGAGIGGAAGLGAVLLTRGPGIRLPRGTSMEMQLDRTLTFEPSEIIFVGSAPPPPLPPAPVGPGNEPNSWPTHRPFPGL